MTQRSHEPEVVTVGSYDDNSTINYIIYNVEFPDGTIKEYSVDLIADNMLTQYESDGLTKSTMDGIIDHKV